MKKIIFIFILLLIFSVDTYAAVNINKNAGAVAAIFLRLGVSVRAIGMGNSFTAVGDGINATYGNPAGVIDLRTSEVNIMHSNWLAGINYGYLGFAYPLTDATAISISIIDVDYGNFEGRDISGIPIDNPTARSDAIAFTFGRRVSENVIAGLNLKYIDERLENTVATGNSIDLGVVYRAKIHNLFLGFAIQNLGPSMKFKEIKFRLPLTYRVGVMYKLYQDKLITSCDIVKSIDTDWTISLGTEITIGDLVSLRTGYTNEADIGSGLSGGLGFYISKFTLDYAFMPFGELGDTHRMSLTYKF